MKNAIIKSFAIGVVLVAGATSIFAQAQSGYLNATNDVFNNVYVPAAAGLVMTNGEELGNEIVMMGNGNDNYLTNFTFEYFGTSGGSASNANFNGDVQAKVSFYVNNGTSLNGYLSPAATPFYTWDSLSDGINGSLAGTGWLTPTFGSLISISVQGGDFGAITNSYLGGIQLPSREITYTITFTGLSGDDLIGLTSVGGSAIGTVYSGYWLKEPNGTFQYLTNGANNSINAELQAVPEPTSMALVGMGGLAMLVAAKRRFSK